MTISIYPELSGDEMVATNRKWDDFDCEIRLEPLKLWQVEPYNRIHPLSDFRASFHVQPLS